MIGLGSGLSGEDRETVVAAIRRAETRTAAEIVVVVDRIAGGWRSWSLAVALLLALLLPWPLIELTQLSTRTIFTVQLALALGLVLAFQPQSMRLKLVPRLLTRRKGHEAALREFTARGLSATEGRTGLLIYVAMAERYAEIVTDTGLTARIGDKAWRGLIEALIESIRQEDLAGGLVRTVDGAADILAPLFPPRPGDRDEIPNKVIVI
jgi:putative membrane protein